MARTQSIVETDFRYEKNKINGGRVSRFKTVGRSEIQGGGKQYCGGHNLPPSPG